MGVSGRWGRAVRNGEDLHRITEKFVGCMTNLVWSRAVHVLCIQQRENWIFSLSAISTRHGQLNSFAGENKRIFLKNFSSLPFFVYFEVLRFSRAAPRNSRANEISKYRTQNNSHLTDSQGVSVGFVFIFSFFVARETVFFRLTAKSRFGKEFCHAFHR